MGIDFRPVRLWLVTGTYHGSYVYAQSEGDARRAFHAFYNGESITHIAMAGRDPDVDDLDDDILSF